MNLNPSTIKLLAAAAVAVAGKFLSLRMLWRKIRGKDWSTSNAVIGKAIREYPANTDAGGYFRSVREREFIKFLKGLILSPKGYGIECYPARCRVAAVA